MDSTGWWSGTVVPTSPGDKGTNTAEPSRPPTLVKVEPAVGRHIDRPSGLGACILVAELGAFDICSHTKSDRRWFGWRGRSESSARVCLFGPIAHFATCASVLSVAAASHTACWYCWSVCSSAAYHDQPAHTTQHQAEKTTRSGLVPRMASKW